MTRQHFVKEDPDHSNVSANPAGSKRVNSPKFPYSQNQIMVTNSGGTREP